MYILKVIFFGILILFPLELEAKTDPKMNNPAVLEALVCRDYCKWETVIDYWRKESYGKVDNPTTISKFLTLRECNDLLATKSYQVQAELAKREKGKIIEMRCRLSKTRSL